MVVQKIQNEQRDHGGQHGETQCGGIVEKRDDAENHDDSGGSGS